MRSDFARASVRLSPNAEAGAGGPATPIAVDAAGPGTPVPRGAFGYGAMWRRQDLAVDIPSGDNVDAYSNAKHGDLLKRIRETYAPLLKEAGARALSFNWGVTMGTLGDPLVGVGPFEGRKVECRPGSGINEKPIVGPGDIAGLAQAWGLEAVVFAAPIFGMDPLFKTIPLPMRKQTAAYAARLVEAVGCESLVRIVGVGTEVSPLGLARKRAQGDQLDLVSRVRDALPPSVIVAPYAMRGAGWSALDKLKANGVNKPLYERFAGRPGVALDVHPYVSGGGWKLDASGRVSSDPANVDKILGLADKERIHLRVSPGHWGGAGKAARGVALEFALEGVHKDKKAGVFTDPVPWPVTLGTVDLLRECFSAGVECALKWAWKDDHPEEWVYGAVVNGKLTPTARALGFFAEHHRGALVAEIESGGVRGLVSKTPAGPELFAYGGNFSRSAAGVALGIAGFPARSAEVEVLTEAGVAKSDWDPKTELALPPLSLWRMRIARAA